MRTLFSRCVSVAVIGILILSCAMSAVAAGVAGGAHSNTYTTLRAAVKEGLLTMKVKGDGETTAKVSLGLTNKTAKPLKVVVPANEVLLSKTLSVQNMMVTQDRIVTIPANGAVWADIPTACVSAKTVAPPPGQELEFSAGAYPDAATWKQLAGIIAAAKLLNKSGAFERTMFAKERRESIISQLAIWKLLGSKSSDPKDKVTPEAISEETLAKMGVKKDQLSKEKQAMFDKGVDEIFQAVDLTVRKAAEPEVQQIASLPGDSRGITFNQVGARALESGNFTEAEELLTAAVDEAGVNEKDPALSTSLQQLGQCYLSEGKPEDATQYFKRAAELREKYAGAEFAETAESFNALGLAYKGSGKYKEAQQAFERALAIREKSLGPNATLTGDTLNSLAMVYLANGQADDAEKEARRAMLIRYKNLGPESPQVAEVNKTLGDIYEKQGKYPQAEKAYKRALELAQNSLGKQHPYVGVVADGLADCYRAMGRESDADELAKQSGGIKEKSLGSNSVLIAAVPQDYQSIARLALFSNNAEKMEVGAKELMTDRSVPVNRPAPNRPVRDKWALVIGVSKFKDPSISLKYASKDAQDFATYLTKEAHFAPDHVRVLLDENATRENIMNEVGDSWLPHTAMPDDLVLIYVSSHGSPSQADVKGTNYLIAYNTDKNSLYATGIPMRELTKMIKDRVKAERVVLVLDACHSGAADAGKGIVRQANFDAESVMQGSGQLVICSSEPSQTSWESSKYPNGVFTHYLIEGLRKSGDKTALGSAFQYMKDKVQKEVLQDRGELQTPVLKSRWEGNELLLATPPADPGPGLSGQKLPVSASH